MTFSPINDCFSWRKIGKRLYEKRIICSSERMVLKVATQIESAVIERKKRQRTDKMRGRGEDPGKGKVERKAKTRGSPPPRNHLFIGLE